MELENERKDMVLECTPGKVSQQGDKPWKKCILKAENMAESKYYFLRRYFLTPDVIVM